MIGLWAFYKFIAKPEFEIANAELQRDMIFNGIYLFNHQKGRLPVNLEEVVKAGYLPESSNIYYCPMKHNALGTDEDIYYTECEYDFSFEPNCVKLCIPEKVYYQKEFKHLPKQNKHGFKHVRCIILTKDGELSQE